MEAADRNAKELDKYAGVHTMCEHKQALKYKESQRTPMASVCYQRGDEHPSPSCQHVNSECYYNCGKTGQIAKVCHSKFW